MEEQTVDYHLREAMSHLETAINRSVRIVLENEAAKKEIGRKWEVFFGDFLSCVREKGKKSRMNLLAWITFPRIRG